MTRYFPIVVLLAASAFGCGSTPADPVPEPPAAKVEPVAQTPVATPSAVTGEVVAAPPAVIAGMISYRERMLLPSTSNRVLIELSDAATGAILHTYDESGTLRAPIPFEIEVPSAKLVGVENVMMKAQLFADGQVFFETPKPVLVYTAGAVCWPPEDSDRFLMLNRKSSK
jgi:uncharacterized lipoprotein YbaY